MPELVIAGLLLLAGLRSLLRWFRTSFEAVSPGDAVLYALHASARVALWFAFAGVFLGLGLLDEPSRFRWFALVPLAIAGLQLVTAVLLSREPRSRDPGG